MRYLISMLLCLTAHAFAAELPEAPKPRPIDMTVVLLSMAGTPLANPTLATKEDPACAKCDLTLGAAIALSLCVDRPADSAESALEKAKRCTFGMTLEHQKAAILTASQVTQIESRLANWAPIVAARVIPLIDPNVDLLKP